MSLRPDYVTLAQLKARLRVDDTADDDELERNITSASRAIDDHCNRQFGLADTPTEYIATVWGRDRCGRLLASIPDLMTGVGLSVTVDGTMVDAADVVLTPRNAPLDGLPWTGVRVDASLGEVAVTARWGWTAVPVPVQEATLLQASRFNIRRDSPFGIAGSPDNGNELRLLARVDADVAVALRGLVRPRRPA